MAHFCNICGADTYMCQQCGRIRCSEKNPANWFDGKGNICKTCQKEYPEFNTETKKEN